MFCYVHWPGTQEQHAEWVLNLAKELYNREDDFSLCCTITVYSWQQVALFGYTLCNTGLRLCRLVFKADWVAAMTDFFLLERNHTECVYFAWSKAYVSSQPLSGFWGHIQSGCCHVQLCWCSMYFGTLDPAWELSMDRYIPSILYSNTRAPVAQLVRVSFRRPK